jgi:hypothetical protein
MKNARPEQVEASAAVESTLIVAAGRLPAKLASLAAEVLARLLAGEKLTNLDGVYRASTTRLASVIHYLITKYGWVIQSADKVASCNDGRVAWISEYSLAPAVIAASMAAGAAAWCPQVRKARAALRANAVEAEAYAKRANAARKGSIQRGQFSLFDNEGVPT